MAKKETVIFLKDQYWAVPHVIVCDGVFKLTKRMLKTFPNNQAR
jgi:hypothetical protein